MTKDSRITHGDTRHGTQKRLYRIWHSMETRCYNKNHIAYARYGGRRIRVCHSWRHNYAIFKHWALENGYIGTLSIERRNNDGNYTPANCYFATAKQQQRNTSWNRNITAFGVTKCLSAWIEDQRCKVSWSGLKLRIKNGWRPELAILVPRLDKASGFSKEVKRRIVLAKEVL